MRGGFKEDNDSFDDVLDDGTKDIDPFERFLIELFEDDVCLINCRTSCTDTALSSEVHEEIGEISGEEEFLLLKDDPFRLA